MPLMKEADNSPTMKQPMKYKTYSKLVNTKSIDLSMLPHKNVLQGLKQDLKPFGNIIDVGIDVIPSISIFLSTGYAVLEMSMMLETHFQSLTRIISCCESSEILHAV
ncbi:MAG: hypothetical protein EXX96DRAFT_543028 [Benjaminiella poitrasii]|nr:MAG: hypothetical protein EXX96DRAFT_543028 [Benjaminiella poitrasii]